MIGRQLLELLTAVLASLVPVTQPDVAKRFQAVMLGLLRVSFLVGGPRRRLRHGALGRPALLVTVGLISIGALVAWRTPDPLPPVVT